MWGFGRNLPGCLYRGCVLLPLMLGLYIHVYMKNEEVETLHVTTVIGCEEKQT